MQDNYLKEPQLLKINDGRTLSQKSLETPWECIRNLKQDIEPITSSIPLCFFGIVTKKRVSHLPYQ